MNDQLDTPQAELKVRLLRKFVKVNSHYCFWEDVKQWKMYSYYWILGQETNWESRSKKFVFNGKQKGYKKLLIISGSRSGMDNIPTQDEYKNALEGDTDLNEKS